MLITREKKEQNTGKMFVGIDLGRYSVQISYVRAGMDEPETAEQVTGSEVFNIPMVLCKRAGVNQWFYGREALKYYEREGGYLVDNIFQKALNGEKEEIEGEFVEGIALLTLFLKRSLSILGSSAVSGAISDIMFTFDEMGDEAIGVMDTVIANLALKKCNIYFQSYSESIYSYLIHQDPEIWTHRVICAYFDGNKLTTYTFYRNLRTKPIVTLVDENEITDFAIPKIIIEDTRPAAYAKLDDEFSQIMKEQLGTELYSGVYLLGDGFKDNWCDQSLRFLGRGRRLFMGNDVFSRGACYTLMDKADPSEAAIEHVYLGPDKLKSNVGIDVLRRGEESYLAVLDAGVNWYEAKADFEMFVPEDYTFNFYLISLDGGSRQTYPVVIDNPPDRDYETVRVLLHFEMSDVNTIKLKITDLGFGDLYPSSGLEWNYTMNL